MSKTYQIASHDTMSYMKPKHWWMRPFRWAARCQEYSLEEQYEKHGIRMFDIRLKYTKDGQWEFAHGSMSYGGDVEGVFQYLNSRNEPVMVRMVLEYNRAVKKIGIISELYASCCEKWRQKYTNLTFFGFYRKYDWKQLYSYEGMPYPDIYQATSSTTGWIIDDLYPDLYAIQYNKNILSQGTSHQWLMIDFIGKY